jgi:hypothetical protein
MGANAKRRREEKADAKAGELRAAAQHTGESRTLRRLRKTMRKVKSLEQFALILGQVPQMHRARTRALLWPLLQPHLPCCSLSAYGRHTPFCQHVLEQMGAPQAKAGLN